MIHAFQALGMLAELPKLPTPVDGVGMHAFSGVGPVLIGVGVITVALLVWAVFLRRGPRRARARLLQDEPPSSGHRRRRHRRREHRPSNPTLAETGGLPPVKANAADTDREGLA